MLDVARTLRIGEAKQLVAIVVGHFDAIEGEVGALLEQGSRYEQGAAETFELGCRYVAYMGSSMVRI